MFEITKSNIIFFLFVVIVFSFGYVTGFNKADSSVTVISYDMSQITWIGSHFVEFDNGIIVQMPCGYYIGNSDPYFGYKGLNYTLTPKRC